jgi:cytochrome c oxidase cbb3-type subunit 2
MNRLPLLFLGLFLTFTSSWIGLVMLPYFQIGRMQQIVSQDTGALLPPPLSGQAQQGRDVYAANGCIYCHSQQIRPDYQGSDIARGWGARRTVPRDYLGEKPHYLGTMRTGPDLTNIGVRQRDVNWHHTHLFDPQQVSPGSIMPPYRYLYKLKKIEAHPSADALRFSKPGYVLPGYEIIPTPEAKALVAYLLSLNRNYPLPEAPTE